MGHLKPLICLVLIINMEKCQSSMVIEEELDSNAQVKQAGVHFAKPTNSLTAAEKENLLEILEKRYISNENVNFETFSESLIKFLDSSAGREEEVSRIPIETEKVPGGWSSSSSNNQGQCSSVGKPCSSGGKISESEEEEVAYSKNGGWGTTTGSGWGNGKCCNSDFCINGKCCIPTPSRRNNSHCRGHGDCCNGGLCDNGRCLKSFGQICSDSEECFKSKCINGVCCVPVCSNSTRSNQDKCQVKSHCCGSAVCEMSSGECKSLLGDPCTSSCSSPCVGDKLQCVGNSGKCCIPDGTEGCTNDSDCCYASVGSTCTGTPNKCQINGGMSGGLNNFQFRGQNF